MEGEAEKREYILNETGKIWCGSFKQPKGRRWIYGQFDDLVLPAAIFLLEQSGLNHTDRGSPVQVVRAISQMVSKSFIKYICLTSSHCITHSFTKMGLFIGKFRRR